MIDIDDVRLGGTAIPYVAALDGALRAAGMWDDETWMLAGLSGLAFHLVVDRKTCPSSPTAYHWSDVHSAAAERVGVVSRCVESFDTADFSSRRDGAIRMIETSLDRGRPAVVRTVDWAEFAIVTGYDRDDGVLFLDSRHDDPVLYANFGSPHGSPFLFAQVFDDFRGVDLESAATSSLRYAVVSWRRRSFPKHPRYDYPVGAAGYAALIDAVQKADTDPLGLRYIIRIHADARTCAARFLRRVSQEAVVPGLDSIADTYDAVAPLTARVAELLPAAPPFERPVERDVCDEAAGLLRRCADLEESAVERLETLIS